MSLIELIVEDSATQLPPGMDEMTLTNGFDVTTWQLCYYPVIELSYSQGNTFALGSTSYLLPDNCIAEGKDTAEGTTATAFRGVKTMDEHDFSESVDSSIGADGDSVSASEAVATASTVTDDSSWTTTLISYYVLAYFFARLGDSLPATTATFTAALDALPPTHQPGDIDDAYAHFFVKWGTHYLGSAYVGGTWRMSTAISSDVYDDLTSQKVSTSVEAKFNAGVVSGDTKATITDNTQHDLNLSENNSLIVFDCVGGTPGTEVSSWMQTVAATPEVLNDVTAISEKTIHPTYTPIWTLVSDQNMQAVMKAAWTDYLSYDRDPDHTLPGRDPVPANTIAQATADGFLSAMLATVNNGDGGETYAYSDAGTSPTSLIGAAGVHIYDTDFTSQSSLLIPVKSGDYYNVQYTPHWGTLTPQPAFQAFPLDLQVGEELPINMQHTMPCDGFATGVINYGGENGTRGYMVGAQLMGDYMTAMVTSSVHWDGNTNVCVMTESFCMPVQQGVPFEVAVTSTYGGVSSSALWTPMGNSSVIGKPVPMEPNQVNYADTNGMLVAQLSVPDANGGAEVEVHYFPLIAVVGYATLTLEMSATEDFASPVPLATASANFSDYSIVPYNSASAIVPQGSWYRCTVAAQSSSVTTSLYWVPIVPATSTLGRRWRAERERRRR
jgi:hypothetical protein